MYQKSSVIAENIIIELNKDHEDQWLQALSLSHAFLEYYLSRVLPAASAVLAIKSTPAVCVSVSLLPLSSLNCLVSIVSVSFH